MGLSELTAFLAIIILIGALVVFTVRSFDRINAEVSVTAQMVAHMATRIPPPSIGENASPDMAKAQLLTWQREKELALGEKLAASICASSKDGLDLKRIARVMLAAGQAIAGNAGKDGVGA